MTIFRIHIERERKRERERTSITFHNIKGNCTWYLNCRNNLFYFLNLVCILVRLKIKSGRQNAAKPITVNKAMISPIGTSLRLRHVSRCQSIIVGVCCITMLYQMCRRGLLWRFLLRPLGRSAWRDGWGVWWRIMADHTVTSRNLCSSFLRPATEIHSLVPTLACLA